MLNRIINPEDTTLTDIPDPIPCPECGELYTPLFGMGCCIVCLDHNMRNISDEEFAAALRTVCDNIIGGERK